MNLNSAYRIKDKAGEETADVMTPKAKLLYPNLFEATLMKGEKDPERARYGTTLLFHKSADLKAIQDAVLAAATDKFGAKLKETKWKKPFIKVTEDDQPKVWRRLVSAGIDPNDFPVMIRLASKLAPSVRAPNGQKVEDEDQVYEGRWARASIRAFAYTHATGGNGVSLGLGNVQLLDNDDPLPRGGGGMGGDEFEAVDTGGEGGNASELFD